MSNTVDQNPYAAPAIVGGDPSFGRPKRSGAWLKWLTLLQGIAVIGSIAGQFYQTESIVASGAIISIFGSLIAVFAFRRKDYPSMVFGLSGIAISAFVFGLIFSYSWSPAQASQPVKFISFAYALVAIPASIILFKRLYRW